jgi:PAS domain S-box-containing protein
MERMRRALERGASERAGLVAGLTVLATVVLLDLGLTSASGALVGTYVAAPFIAALLAGPAATATVGVVAVAFAVASPIWNPDTQDSEQVIRVLVVALGAALATGAALVERGSRDRSGRLSLLDSVGAVADGSLPLDQTLRRVTDKIVPVAGDICVIDAVHGGRVTRIAVRAHGRDDAAEVEKRMRQRDPTLPDWLVNVERPWRSIPRWRPRVGDEELRRMANSPEDLEFLRSLGIRSSIVVPIRARDRNLGTLSLLTAWSGRRYDHADLRFAQTLSGRLGLALDNAGLFSDLESVERRMDTVMSILDEAVVIHGSDGELIFVNPAAAELLGFADADEALAAPSGRLGERFTIRDEDGEELGPAALTGRLALETGATEPLTLRVSEREGGGDRWYRTRSRPIDDAGGQALYSVTVIEDITDVKRTEHAQRLLARTGELLTHSSDHRSTLEEVARLLVPEFADWCAVSLARPDGEIEQVAVAHGDPERLELARSLRERYPAHQDDSGAIPDVMRTGEARLITEIDDDTLRESARDERHLQLMRGADLGSAIVAPMPAAGRVVGALTFVNHRGSRSFDADDLAIAVEAARRAGIAIENSRLAGERARLAEVLQRELLPPSLPELEGWEVETMYEPAGEINEVGGDFYEVFRVADGWAIVLGDVAGHGAAAASLTAEARHTIRTAGQLDGDPRSGLHLLNRNLLERDDARLCSTVMLVLPDGAAGACEVTVYLAGHPHPLRIHGEEVDEVGSPGPALGVSEEPVWEPVGVIVHPGDQLILYTDGVTEARRSRDHDRFGGARLQGELAGVRRPQDAIARVRSALEGFRAEQPSDDAALVAIRRSSSETGAPAGERHGGVATEPVA